MALAGITLYLRMSGLSEGDWVIWLLILWLNVSDLCTSEVLFDLQDSAWDEGKQLLRRQVDDAFGLLFRHLFDRPDQADGPLLVPHLPEVSWVEWSGSDPGRLFIKSNPGTFHLRP